MSNASKSYKRVQVNLIEHIPSELKDLRQWVCWRLETRDEGRATKVPVDPKTLGAASTTNPETWSSCVEAILATSKNSRLMGIGFVFTENDPYTGIDIDDCRDSKTGTIGIWAQELIDKLDSYTEVSPSGTGVKIIVNAQLPGAVRRRNKIEMYSEKRYFTMTGEVVGERYEIEERQRQLSEVYDLAFGDKREEESKTVPTLDEEKLKRVQAIKDEDLLERALHAKNGEKFGMLWTASYKTEYPSESEATQALLCILAYWTRGDEERIDRLFRKSKLMRAKWDARHTGSTWGKREIKHAIAQTKNFFDPDVDELLRNDTANADLFRGMIDGEYIRIEEWKTWLKWNGVHWLRDADGEVRQATRRVEEERARRAADLIKSNEEKAKQEFIWAVKSGNAPQRSAIERLVRDMLAQPAELFDTQPLLLACSNGIIDLRTGELRPGLREDRITRGLHIAYDPSAQCPRFERFLYEIMNENEEMVSYLWRVLGYTLTGDTSERAFFMMHGNGRNGKSTLVEVMQSMLGAYSQPARFETFLQKYQTRNDPRDDLAILAGARLVVAQEADESKTLDVALIKTLSGGDKVVARFLYGTNFSFKPTFKLFLVTNHTPKIAESSHALWDRLHYIPFERRFTENEIDPKLVYKLNAELPGILARSVTGCIEWLKEGLAPPTKVVQAGDTLHETMDIPGCWLEECCIKHADAKVQHPALYVNYVEWCKKNGFKHPMTKHSLGSYIKDQGFEDYRGGRNVRWWRGIGLRAEEQETII